MRVNVGELVDKNLLHKFLEKKMIQELKDVHVCRGDFSGMFDHFLVEMQL